MDGLLLVPWPIHYAHNGNVYDSVARHIDYIYLESVSDNHAERVTMCKVNQYENLHDIQVLAL